MAVWRCATTLRNGRTCLSGDGRLTERNTVSDKANVILRHPAKFSIVLDARARARATRLQTRTKVTKPVAIAQAVRQAPILSAPISVTGTERRKERRLDSRGRIERVPRALRSPLQSTDSSMRARARSSRRVNVLDDIFTHRDIGGRFRLSRLSGNVERVRPPSSPPLPAPRRGSSHNSNRDSDESWRQP